MRSQVARKHISATAARNLRTLLLLNVFEPEEIGDRIKQARERAGLRQDDLADLIGMSTRQVQNYEAGATKQYAKLRAIAEATATPVHWLLHGDGDGEEVTGRTPAQLDEVLAAVEGLRSEVQAVRDLVEDLREGPAQAPPGRRRGRSAS